MRCALFLMLFIISLVSDAQVNYSGSYTGKINGDFTQIDMQQSGTEVTGKYIETGNTYDIKAKIVSGNLIGELLIAGTAVPLATFEAAKISSGIHLELLLLGVTRLSADFMSSAGSKPVSTGSNSALKTPDSPTLKPPQDKFERDPAVLGNWLKEEVINSGFGDQAASLVTAYFLSFFPDGNFIQEVASGSGGSNWSMVDNKKPDIAGHWYTKDQIMYVRPTGQKDYSRLNRYLFHDGALVFKTEAGKYLIWNRRI